MMYTEKAYAVIDHNRIAEDVTQAGFNPILIKDGPGAFYPPHEHPETKLLVFLNGSMDVTVGRQHFHCRPGDKLIIPGNTVHSAIAGPEGCTFFWSEKLI